MANETTINRHVYRGYKIAARHLGHLFRHYHPTSAINPLVNFSLVDEVNLAFDKDHNFGFTQPNGYDSHLYYALVDLTTVVVGDYFVDSSDVTFFASNIEPLRPALLVRCNETVRVERPRATRGYGGNSEPLVLMSGWPAGIADGTRGEKNVAGLPESMRGPWVTIHLPHLPGVDILYGDIVVDTLGRRYVVSQNISLSYPTYELACGQEVA